MPRIQLRVDLKFPAVKTIIDEMVQEDKKTDPEATVSSFIRNLIRREYCRREIEKRKTPIPPAVPALEVPDQPVVTNQETNGNP